MVALSRGGAVRIAFVLIGLVAPRDVAAGQSNPPSPGVDAISQAAAVISCVSKTDERAHCPADTSAGVVLLQSSGAGSCLLGKSWGYDDAGVWVTGGCGGRFGLGRP